VGKKTSGLVDLDSQQWRRWQVFQTIHIVGKEEHYRKREREFTKRKGGDDS
jgi:hypothetical protein